MNTLNYGDTFTFIESNSKPYVLESKLTSDDLKNLAFGWLALVFVLQLRVFQ